MVDKLSWHQNDLKLLTPPIIVSKPEAFGAEAGLFFFLEACRIVQNYSPAQCE